MIRKMIDYNRESIEAFIDLEYTDNLPREEFWGSLRKREREESKKSYWKQLNYCTGKGAIAPCRHAHIKKVF